MARTYKPLLQRYLSRTRMYTYRGIRLEIPPEVFHPGFFSSSQLLLQYVAGLSLKGKQLWEPGAGSGLISIYAAREGADVTASDINPVAISCLQRNAGANGVQLEIIESDLYSKMPEKTFDIIAINPPYYLRQPRTPAEHAWYCGENGEYFTGLFSRLTHYIHERSEVIMVCCDGCDVKMIADMATDKGFRLNCMLIRPGLLENHFIFKLEQRK